MSVEHAVTVAAARGLPGASAVEATLATADDVDRFVGEVRAHGLQGQAIEACTAGKLTGPGLHDKLLDALHGALLSCLVAEAAAVNAVDVLTEHGIDMLVLKGVATAHLDYPAPELRLFGDADVLIRPGDHGKALEVLAAEGYRRVSPPVHQWWERRFGRTVTHIAPNGAELDMHLRIAGGSFGFTINHEDIWERAGEGFVLAGRQMRALAGPHRLFHACCHTVLGDNSGLRSQRDVAQLLLDSEVDWDETVEIAEASGCSTVVAAAIRRTWRNLTLNSHPASVWANGHVDNAEQLAAIEAYELTFATDWAPEGLTSLSALSPMDKVLYLAVFAGDVVPER